MLTDFTILGILFLLIAAVLFVVFIAYSSPQVRIITGIVAILLVGVALFGGASFNPQTQQIATPAGPSASVQITNIGGLTGATLLNASSNTLQVAANVNVTTSTPVFISPSGGIVKFHFDLMRTDQGSSAAIFGLAMNNPSIYNTTSQKNYNFIDQYSSNKTNEITFQTPSGSFTGGNSLVSVPSGGKTQVNVTMTLNPYAFATMPHYSTQQVTMDVSIGGQQVASITVDLVYAVATS